MSEMYLCHGKKAVIPLFVEDEYINLYSIEELCYYINKYSYVCDDSFITEKLAKWINKQLGLNELSRKTGRLVGKPGALISFVKLLEQEVGYFSQDEWTALEDEINGSEKLLKCERRKIKADRFLGENKFYVAMDQYNCILKDNEADEIMIAKCYHNLGVCLCNLFMFERAAVFFEKAWSINHSDESMLHLLAAKKLYMSETEYLQYLSKKPESCEYSLELEKIMENIRAGWKEQPVKKFLGELQYNSKAFYDGIDSISEEVRNEYRDISKRG